jgi:DNA primase
VQLDRKQRQLVDFLVLYPEFLPELQQGGLEELQCAPVVTTIITTLRQSGNDGPCMPEHLLSVLPGEADRQYIADLLMRGPGDIDDPEEHGRMLCNELLCWLQSVRRQRQGADLQQEISRAQQAGDTARVMELLRQIQQNAGKKTEFDDNLLKEV